MVAVNNASNYIEVSWAYNDKIHVLRISKTNGLITYYAVNGISVPLRAGSLVGYIHPRFYTGSKSWYPSLSPSTCNVSITEQTSARIVVEVTTKLRDDAGNEADNSFTITYTIEDNEPVKISYSMGSGSSITSLTEFIIAMELENTSYIITADRAVFEPPFSSSDPRLTQDTRERWFAVKTNNVYIGAILKSPVGDKTSVDQFYRSGDAMFDVNIYTQFTTGYSTFPVTMEVEIVADTVRHTIHRRYHDLFGVSHDWRNYDIATILKKYKGARNVADSFGYSNYEKQAYVAFHHWLWLYEITGDMEYLNKAKTIADNIIANNYSSSIGIFLSGTTGEDHENGVICMLLLRLYELTGNSNYLTYVKNVLQAFFIKRKTTGELPRRYNNGTWEYMSESTDEAYPNMSSDGYELVSAYYWYRKLTNDNFADDYINDIENYYAQFWDDTLKMFYVGENANGIVRYFSIHQLNSHHLENVYMRMKAGVQPTYAELIDSIIRYMYRAEDVHAGFYLDYIDTKPYPIFGTLDSETAPWAINAYNALNVAVWLCRLINEGLLEDKEDYRKAIKESVWYGVAAMDDNGYNKRYTVEDEVVTSGDRDWLAPYLGGFLSALWSDNMPIVVDFGDIQSYSWDGKVLTIEGGAGTYRIIFKNTGRYVAQVRVNGKPIPYRYDQNTGIVEFTVTGSTIEVITSETPTTSKKKAGFPWIPVIILLTSAGVYIYVNKGE